MFRLSDFVFDVFRRLFFFSSRRRHTRYWRDWSSDVCSSDLALRQETLAIPHQGEFDNAIAVIDFYERELPTCTSIFRLVEWCGRAIAEVRNEVRSEERRVGKEGRSRWSPYH